MSYCRWSSDDYQCDVYCYEDVFGGYSIHVADKRPILDCELPERINFSEENVDKWVARNKLVTNWLNRAEYKQIGLLYDGKTFMEPDAKSTADRLKMLKDIGYNVPQYAIDSLIKEYEDTLIKEHE